MPPGSNRGSDGSVEGRPLDEVELVDRAKRGDTGAYSELVRRYQRLAHRTAFVITGSRADADDAAQEAFVKAYFALDRFRSEAAFRPWLMKIVANEARNRRKASGRRAALAVRLAEGRPSGDGVASPEGAALAADRRAALVAGINRLREEDRQVLAYRYFLDLSEAEMAAAMGCRRGTVKSRLSRAMARLREVVAENDIVDSQAAGDGSAE